MVRDLDLGAFNRLDGRRLEIIIADGLPLLRGAQLSPINADGTARRHAARRNGIALEAARRAKKGNKSWRFSWRHPIFFAVLCLPRFGVCLRLLMGRLMRNRKWVLEDIFPEVVWRQFQGVHIRGVLLAAPFLPLPSLRSQ